MKKIIFALAISMLFIGCGSSGSKKQDEVETKDSIGAYQVDVDVDGGAVESELLLTDIQKVSNTVIKTTYTEDDIEYVYSISAPDLVEEVGDLFYIYETTAIPVLDIEFPRVWSITTLYYSEDGAITVDTFEFTQNPEVE